MMISQFEVWLPHKQLNKSDIFKWDEDTDDIYRDSNP